MENESEIRGLKRANQGSPIHYLGDALQPLEILILSTTVLIAGNVLRTRSVRTPGSNGVPLRVECLGLRHAPGHPKHDDGIRRGLRTSGAYELWFAPG
jgi:hypothetical protein